MLKRTARQPDRPDKTWRSAVFSGFPRNNVSGSQPDSCPTPDMIERVAERPDNPTNGICRRFLHEKLQKILSGTIPDSARQITRPHVGLSGCVSEIRRFSESLLLGSRAMPNLGVSVSIHQSLADRSILQEVGYSGPRTTMSTPAAFRSPTGPRSRFQSVAGVRGLPTA